MTNINSRKPAETLEQLEDEPSEVRIWIDMDSGTWGTSKIVGVSIEEARIHDLFTALTEGGDEEVIEIGHKFGTELRFIDPSKRV